MEHGETSFHNIIVTGGAGYIGSHVILSLLLTRKFKIISIDNYSNSHAESLERVSKIARESLPVDASEEDKFSVIIDDRKVDLTNSLAVREVFEAYGKGNIWGLIHIAALKAVGESGTVPIEYYRVNVAATITLLQLMDEFELHRLVYSSSAAVYGIPPKIPTPETTALKAKSVYGRTKAISETIIKDICQSNPKWRVISLRYFNPAGAYESGQIGEHPVGIPENLLPRLAQMAAEQVEGPVNVFGNEYNTRDGTCVRDYIHVVDLAEGHRLALEALSDGSLQKTFGNVAGNNVNYKAYNLGTGHGKTVLEVVNVMKEVTNFAYEIKFGNPRAGDAPTLTADPALAKTELGFSASSDLERICRDLWNWQAKNPAGYGTQRAQRS
ncbi:UDP-glucose 4-epimerase [Cantharellus anzutake]|uniref:UDP-glucose 4-epimerase n=1 Tax=Cantharellus anzutake TaxID=1750568 RepID=UPI001907A29B|nr:UDP-glucose 4-epimerase [Cantharellus anzutake]KAF8336838.1 UDP-glucose 4-epimerase [Cantharellus anzutake]